MLQPPPISKTDGIFSRDDIKRGLVALYTDYTCSFCGRNQSVHPTDITTVWEVLEKLGEAGWSWIVGRDHADSKKRFCRLWNHMEPPSLDGKRRCVVTEYASTAPLAICQAILKVIKI